jgi:HEAT repeat protein
VKFIPKLLRGCGIATVVVLFALFVTQVNQTVAAEAVYVFAAIYAVLAVSNGFLAVQYSKRLMPVQSVSRLVFILAVIFPFIIPFLIALKGTSFFEFIINKLKERKDLAALITVLMHEDLKIWGDEGYKLTEIRRRTAIALGYIGDPRAVESLAETLVYYPIMLRSVATSVFGKPKADRDIEYMIKSFWQEKASYSYAFVPERANALSGIEGDEAKKTMIGALYACSRNAGIRIRAAEALGRIGDPRGVEPLIAALQDWDDTVRRTAAEALEKIGDPRAAKALRIAVEDKDYNVREAATNALKKLKVEPRPQPASQAPEKGISIPQIGPNQVSITLFESRELGAAGPGEASFQEAIKASNSQNYTEAERHFREALQQGLDRLREGYVHANLGRIRLKDNDLQGAIEQFLAVFVGGQSLYESAHDAAQNMAVIMQELGRQDEASLFTQLSAKTAAHLGYSLSPTAAEAIRQIVRSARGA